MSVNTGEKEALDFSSVGWGGTHQNLLFSLGADSPRVQPETENTNKNRPYLTGCKVMCPHRWHCLNNLKMV